MSPAAILAGDPLLADGVDGVDLLIVAIKTLVVFVVVLVGVMLMVWFERKLISDMQNRIGPNRAGPWGLLQTLADGVKLFFKEDLLPERADRRVFRLAPYLSIIPAFLSFAIVPLGGVINIGDRATRMQLADPPIGILFLLAMSSVAVYGVMLAGWSSGSKYPLLGSVRASAQMISYEAALGLSIAAVILYSGSLEISDIVASQSGRGPLGILPSWHLISLGVIPFVIFMTAATAELNRPPFDMVEAEQELVGGFMTEYSSVRFALFYLAEFMNTITMSAIIVTLFLGGPNGPILLRFPGATILWPLVWFLLKLFAFLFTYVWFRATLPRLRYDQLMDLGWKVLIPISLAWLLLLAAIRITDDSKRFLYLGIGVIVGFLAAAALMRAMTVGRRRTDEGFEGDVGFARRAEVSS